MGWDPDPSDRLDVRAFGAERMTAEDLERMIDRQGLAAVCDMLAQICHEKADHIASNWQDRALAREWTVCARAIDRAAGAARGRLP